METNEMMPVYLDHMMNPRNYGKLEEYDGAGIGKNPQNGESVILYLGIKDCRIDRIAFQVKACGTTVVAGSIFTDTVKGVDLEEAKVLTAIMLDKLDELPEAEAACSEIVSMAMLAALEHYERRRSDPEAPVVTKMIEKSCAESQDAQSE